MWKNTLKLIQIKPLEVKNAMKYSIDFIELTVV